MAYLQWEKQVELIFDCHQFSEEKKVKLSQNIFIGNLYKNFKFLDKVLGVWMIITNKWK